MTKQGTESVAIVDDDPASRESFEYTVEDARLLPLPADGPLGSMEDAIARVRDADVLLSDYELRAKNYATFTGAELVASRQRAGQPAVLCTKYEKPQIERIRPLRRWIPVLLAPAELYPESLLDAIRICRGEARNEFEPERKPWRSLVHFVEPDPESPGRFFVELPSWDLDMMIPVHTDDLPQDVREAAQAGLRCHAMVNLGSERYEDLYLYDWSV